MGDYAEVGCQQAHEDLREASLPDPDRGRLHHRVWWTLKKYLLYSRILGPTNLLQAPELRSRRVGSFALSRGSPAQVPAGTLGLRPGELVKVRTAEEIFATLDSNGRHKGLGINPEQMGYCGKELRVFKVVDKIRLESTGELRRMKAPTVLLEGAICDGRFHGGCDRSCFCFWREEWLERVPAKDAGR